MCNCDEIAARSFSDVIFEECRDLFDRNLGGRMFDWVGSLVEMVVSG